MIFQREPAMIRAAIMAILTLAISFGLSITDVQLGHIEAVIVAVLVLLIPGASTRSKVTPV